MTSNPNDLVSLRQPTRGKERALNERAQECGRALDSVESFSCSAATGFAARCSAYDTCFAFVLNFSYASAYPCTIDFERFRAMSDKTGAIAHISWSTGADAQSNGINQSSSCAGGHSLCTRELHRHETLGFLGSEPLS